MAFKGVVCYGILHRLLHSGYEEGDKRRLPMMFLVDCRYDGGNNYCFGKNFAGQSQYLWIKIVVFQAITNCGYGYAFDKTFSHNPGGIVILCAHATWVGLGGAKPFLLLAQTHTHTRLMLRYEIFSCTCTHTGC